MARKHRREPQEELALGSRLVVGAIAGFVATLAMTAAMRRLHQPAAAKLRYPLTPQEIGTAVAPRPAVAPDLTLVAHFAYGAACGAVLAALSPRPGRVGGALAGGTVWLTSYMGWIPAVGLLKPAPGHKLRRNAMTFAAHVSWGWSTAEAIRELSAARVTLVADGPKRDVPAGSSRRGG
jgi:hypothetical protein